MTDNFATLSKVLVQLFLACREGETPDKDSVHVLVPILCWRGLCGLLLHGCLLCAWGNFLFLRRRGSSSLLSLFGCLPRGKGGRFGILFHWLLSNLRSSSCSSSSLPRFLCRLLCSKGSCLCILIRHSLLGGGSFGCCLLRFLCSFPFCGGDCLWVFFDGHCRGGCGGLPSFLGCF